MKKPSILIVDDEKNAREGLARALRQYDVKLADNGQTALDLLRAAPVDVVLSDVRMPGMDGLTLLQRAMTLSPQPVCIMLTAYGTIEVAVEAMRRGAYDFMTKPINLDRLEILLKRALHTRKVETENQAYARAAGAQVRADQHHRRIAGHAGGVGYSRQVAPARSTVLITGEAPARSWSRAPCTS